MTGGLVEGELRPRSPPRPSTRRRSRGHAEVLEDAPCDALVLDDSNEPHRPLAPSAHEHVHRVRPLQQDGPAQPTRATRIIGRHDVITPRTDRRHRHLRHRLSAASQWSQQGGRRSQCGHLRRRARPHTRVAGPPGALASTLDHMRDSPRGGACAPTTLLQSGQKPMLDSPSKLRVSDERRGGGCRRQVAEPELVGGLVVACLLTEQPLLVAGSGTV